MKKTDTMTINNNTSKEEIVALLESAQNKRSVEKGLRDRIKYTVKKCREDMKNATRKDLLGLFDELVKATPDLLKTGAVSPVEASAKPKAPKAPKAAGTAPKTPKAPKAPKPTPKKPDPKEKVQARDAVNPKRADQYPLVMYFPETIENEALGTLTAATDKFTSYKEFVEYYNDENAPTTLYLLVYWPKRLIKQFNYSDILRVPAPKEFPEDLDILEPYYFCENVDQTYCVSRYTEANYFIPGGDEDPFPYVIDKDPRDNSEIKTRYIYGMHFEVYEAAK